MNTVTLLKAAALLTVPRTPTALARALGASKPTAYKVVRELAHRGYRFEVSPIREGLRGPISLTYMVTELPSVGGRVFEAVSVGQRAAIPRPTFDLGEAAADTPESLQARVSRRLRDANS